MGQAGFEQQKCEAHEMIQGAASGQRQTTGHWNDLDCANPVCKNTMWPPIAKLLDVSIQDVWDFVWLGLFAQTATSWPVSASQARHDETYCRTQVCVTVILVNVAPLKCNASSFYQPDMSWQSWYSNGHPILTILRLLGLERKKTRHAKLYQGSSAHKKSLVLITKTTDAPAAWLRAPVSMTKVLTTECMNSWPILRQVWREINSTDLFLCCQIGAEKKKTLWDCLKADHVRGVRHAAHVAANIRKDLGYLWISGIMMIGEYWRHTAYKPWNPWSWASWIGAMTCYDYSLLMTDDSGWFDSQWIQF